MATYRGQPIDVVIDVRSRLEFWLGHLNGARCLPVDGIADSIKAQTDVTHSTRIFVYCASGARSALAASTLRTLGYTRVTDGGAMRSASPDFVA